MKRKRAARAMQLMREALAELGEDISLQEARDHLVKALRSTTKVEIKRTTANDNHNKFVEQAMKNNQKWMDSLKSGLEKLTSQTLGEANHKDDQTGTSSEPH